MSQEQESCASCRFWREIADADISVAHKGTGWCRIDPPMLVEKMLTDEYDIYLATVHPVTDEDQWCGKWERK